MVTDTGTDVGYAIRVVVPVIYILIGILSVTCNIIALQLICASRVVHKAIHIFLCSIIIEDILYVIIFVIIRSVSYAYLSATWFLNVELWCKAEMYLLRVFDFVLAYTIVAMCFDRVCSTFSSCLCVRQLRTGVATVFAIWIFSSYILIPILLFNQNISIQAYGGYLCYTTDESVPLAWLNARPRRALDFIDFIFRIVFPIFLMGLFLISMLIQKLVVHYRNKRKAKYETVGILRNRTKSSTDSLIENVAIQKLKYMVLAYCAVFFICQLPYEIYRAVLTWHDDLEYKLRTSRMDFAIEIPLLMLKLINRTINPFLVIFLADEEQVRKRFCRLWCLPCLPCCIGCGECWCLDCGRAIKDEINHCLGYRMRKSKKENWVPTGYQTINTTQYVDGTYLVTKKLIREEFETGVEPYYKNPRERMVNTDEWQIVYEPTATPTAIAPPVIYEHEPNTLNTISRDVDYRPNTSMASTQNQSFVKRIY